MPASVTVGPNILLTGFEPFGQCNVNTSWEIVAAIPGLPGMSLTKLLLPVAFKASVDILLQKIDELQPDFVVSLGQASSRDTFSLERVAVNIADARQPDNEGYRPQNLVISPAGQKQYASTLPIFDIFHTLQSHGIPVSLSDSAGTYVCNHLMYSTLHYITVKELPVKAGFIHVPGIARLSAANATLNMEAMQKALVLTLETLRDEFAR